MRKKIKFVIILCMIVLLFMAQTSSFAAHGTVVMPTTPAVHNTTHPNMVPNAAPKQVNIPKNIPHPTPNTPMPQSQPQNHEHARDHWEHHEGKEHSHSFFSTFFYPENYIPSYVIYSIDPYDFSYVNYNYSDNQSSEPMQNNPLPEDEAWVEASNGDVPEHAISYRTLNDSPTFYCMVQYENINYYGELVPNDGCYITKESQTYHVNAYMVLTKKVLGEPRD